MSETIKKRYEFTLLFDVENGNPNGDPDAGNMPRIDPETNHGIVTDVCLKRKIRNYVELAKGNEPGYGIYVTEGVVLNNLNKGAYEYLGIEPTSKKLPSDKKTAAKLTEFMCKNYFDIRAFGAVMSMEINCGQVRGPIQLNFAKSQDPVFQQEIAITRMAVTNEKDAEKERTIGRKFVVPYGLYRVDGYVSAALANKPLYEDEEGKICITQFSEQDVELLWEALINMFEHDHSAARGKMASRNLIVFEHSDILGNAPAHKLFERVKITKISDGAPRSYQDYEVMIDKADLPEGIKIIEKL